MHIYIDEAGSFIIPARDNYISCVVGLIVPSAQRKFLFDRFLQLRTSWGSKDAEIKGRTLDEKQIARVIEALITYDAIVKIVAIDPASHTKDGVSEFKERQADKLAEHIGPDHHPNMVTAMKQLQERLRNTSNQLFIEAFLSTLLIDRILKDGTLYWSQRSGKELGEFVWTIDAKDRSITKAEEMWKTLLLPFLETGSFTDPLPAVNDPAFDYSYFDKNFGIDQTDEEWKQHLDWIGEVRGTTPQNTDPVDIKAILSDLTFANSADEIGLQIVDVVASAFHRACKGTLQKAGWEKLGSLFLNTKESIVDLVILGTQNEEDAVRSTRNPHIVDVLKTLRSGARSMFVS